MLTTDNLILTQINILWFLFKCGITFSNTVGIDTFSQNSIFLVTYESLHLLFSRGFSWASLSASPCIVIENKKWIFHCNRHCWHVKIFYPDQILKNTILYFGLKSTKLVKYLFLNCFCYKKRTNKTSSLMSGNLGSKKNYKSIYYRSLII